MEATRKRSTPPFAVPLPAAKRLPVISTTGATLLELVDLARRSLQDLQNFLGAPAAALTESKDNAKARGSISEQKPHVTFSLGKQPRRPSQRFLPPAESSPTKSETEPTDNIQPVALFQTPAASVHDAHTSIPKSGEADLDVADLVVLTESEGKATSRLHAEVSTFEEPRKKSRSRIYVSATVRRAVVARAPETAAEEFGESSFQTPSGRLAIGKECARSDPDV